MSIKITNPIESAFATVKLETNAARRIKTPRTALYLVFQSFLRVQRNWRLDDTQLVINAIEGVKFEGGLDVKPKILTTPKHAA